MSALSETLRDKLKNRTARIGVVGLGYVGLPLAVELAKAGFHTTGIDLDARKVQAIDEGRSYIPDVSTEDVQALSRAGKLEATTDFAVVRELDTINICVPTPLRKTKDPDMSLHRVGRGGNRQVPASRHADHPGIDHLSRHDRRSRPADARRDGAQGRRRFLPGVFSRARRSRETQRFRRTTCPR